MESNVELYWDDAGLDVLATVIREDEGYFVEDLRVYFRNADVTDQFSKAEIMRLEDQATAKYAAQRAERRAGMNEIFELAASGGNK